MKFYYTILVIWRFLDFGTRETHSEITMKNSNVIITLRPPPPPPPKKELFAEATAGRSLMNPRIYSVLSRIHCGSKPKTVFVALKAFYLGLLDVWQQYNHESLFQSLYWIIIHWRSTTSQSTTIVRVSNTTILLTIYTYDLQYWIT